MQYVGGKQKSGGDKIAVEIHKLVERVGAEHVIEQCCGGLSVTQRLGDLEVTARDACVPLITLYKAMQAGWVPPAEVDGKCEIQVSTGGWSGVESVVWEVLEHPIMRMSLATKHRGGHYVFLVPLATRA